MESGTAKTSLGIVPSRLGTKRHCGSDGCEYGSGEPMGQTRPSRWQQSFGNRAHRRSPSGFERSGLETTGEAARQRCRIFWISGSSMEQSPGRPTDPARIWDPISSRACQPIAKAFGMDAAEAHRACQTTGSKGGRTLVARALAKAEKKIRQEGWTLIFVDESGFYLLPMVIRSYAPRGLTPLLKEYLSRDHLAALGAITPQGKLFLSTHSQAISTQEVIEFLGFLQKRIPGRLLILWDNSPNSPLQETQSLSGSGCCPTPPSRAVAKLCARTEPH